MSFRSGTQKYATEEQKIEQIERMILLNEGITVEDPKRGTLIDEFVSVSGGYNRNFALEKRIIDELGRVEQYKTKFKGVMNPLHIPEPSYWATYKHGWREDYPNDADALEYLERSKALEKALIDLWDYKCNSYPRDTNYCQNATQRKGTVNRINALIGLVQASIKESEFKFPDILPEVFAEEDPSINSGLNGNEQESQVINYPQSANVRIIISNISMFSTSIPINDISQLQILSNASNEWRYTLIGSSTNQPLMTLSGLVTKINSMIASAVTPQPQPEPEPEPEPEPTTIHVPPPEIMPIQEQGESCEVYRSRLQSLGWHVDWISDCPTPTPTPTEPGQVNWIPEPFFSFINNVFRVR